MIVGLYFIVVMTFLHDSAGDFGFTTTFYIAAGLTYFSINGQKLRSIADKLVMSVNY